MSRECGDVLMDVRNDDGGQAEDEEAFEADAAVQVEAAWRVIPPAGMEDFFKDEAGDVFERASNDGAS